MGFDDAHAPTGPGFPNADFSPNCSCGKQPTIGTERERLDVFGFFSPDL